MSAVATQAQPVKVVAVFLEGNRVEQGTVRDFSPRRDKCTICPAEGGSGQEPKEIEISKLKAIFFVKEFSDSGHHQKTHSEEFVGTAHGRKMEVTFLDGQQLRGTTEGYSPARLGFFLLPADPGGNNLRVFVVNSSVRCVAWL